MFFKKKISKQDNKNKNTYPNPQNKSGYVHQMFDSLAKDYDKLNDIMTFGLHQHIKKQVIANVPIKPGASIVDLCTGTGDIAIYLAKYHKSSKVIGVDFSKNMLDIAVSKSQCLDNIEFVQANVLDLPFKSDSFDISFISFGLRNLEDIEKGIKEMKRITRKGGYVVNLDLGKPKSNIDILHRLYFFNIVPIIGKIFHGDVTPYKYLPESSKNFPSQEELVKLFKQLGFSEVKNYNYAFGTLAQQVAKVKNK